MFSRPIRDQSGRNAGKLVNKKKIWRLLAAVAAGIEDYLQGRVINMEGKALVRIGGWTEVVGLGGSSSITDAYGYRGMQRVFELLLMSPPFLLRLMIPAKVGGGRGRPVNFALHLHLNLGLVNPSAYAYGSGTGS